MKRSRRSRQRESGRAIAARLLRDSRCQCGEPGIYTVHEHDKQGRPKPVHWCYKCGLKVERG